MTYDVTITDDGELQLSDDGMMTTPLAIEAVQALYARVPDAQAAAGRVGLTGLVRELTALLASTPGMSGTFTITGDALDATVPAAAFAAIQQAWGATPDPTTGALVHGPATIHQAAP